MPDLDTLRADARVVWTDDILRFGDTDANGHINNAAFAVFCESGRVNLLHGVLGPAREPGQYFVVAKLTITFRAELHYPGRVRCGSWLRALGRSSLAFGQVLLDDQDRLAATAESVTVLMDAATRRSTPVGVRMRDVIAPLLKPDPQVDASGG